MESSVVPARADVDSVRVAAIEAAETRYLYSM
jgi:hypothetical protein